MPNQYARSFLYSAKNKAGRSVTDRVTAPDIKSAAEYLRVAGFTDVVFHEDSIGDATRRMMNQGSATSPRPTPEDELKARNGPHPTSVGTFLKARLWSFLFLLFLWGGLVLVGDFTSPSAWILYFCTLIYVLFVGLGLVLYVPMAMFNALIAASADGDDDEVLACIARIRSVRWVTAAIPEFDLAVREGRIWARRGMLPEAIEKLERFLAQPHIEPWMWKGRVASVYGAAGDSEKAIELTRAMLHEGPGEATARIDLAMLILMERGALEEGRALLEEIERAPLIDLARPYLPLLRGLVALEAGETERAEAEFSESLHEAEAKLPGVILMKSLIVVVQGWRALALLRLGRGDEARTQMAPIAERLRRERNDRLMQLWDAESAAAASQFPQDSAAAP